MGRYRVLLDGAREIARHSCLLMDNANLDHIVRKITADFVSKMLRLAREHLATSLSSFEPAGSAAAGPLLRAAAPSGILPRLPPPIPVVHAADHVERLVQLVKDHPWPPQSRELQRLLGVKKDPFLRIVSIALATGRITRSGQKAGVRYHPKRGRA